MYHASTSRRPIAVVLLPVVLFAVIFGVRTSTQQDSGYSNNDNNNDKDNGHDDDHDGSNSNSNEKDQQRLRHSIEKKKNLIMFGVQSDDHMNDHELKMLVTKLLRVTEVQFDSAEVVSVQKLPKTRFPYPPILVKLVSGSLQSMLIRKKIKLTDYNVRLENDLDSKTIRKQKRLVPLRNKLLEAHFPCVYIKFGKLFVRKKALNSQEVMEYAEKYDVKLSAPIRR